MRDNAQTLIAGHSVLTNHLPQWNFGHLQQDASEFLQSLLALQTDMAWCAKIEGFEVEQMDVGLVLLLDMGDGQTDMEDLIRAWHSQFHVHGLISSPALVCLQLGRYTNGRKISTPLQWPDQVSLPVFEAAESMLV